MTTTQNLQIALDNQIKINDNKDIAILKLTKYIKELENDLSYQVRRKNLYRENLKELTGKNDSKKLLNDSQFKIISAKPVVYSTSWD